MTKDDFLKEYKDIAGDHEPSWSEDEIEYVYLYNIGHDTYFLVASGIPGITSIHYNVYKKTDGELSFYTKYGGDETIGALFTKCDNELYLMYLPDYDQQTYSWKVVIDKVAPDIVEDYAIVRASVNGYQWEKIYGSDGSYEKAVTEYLDSIRTSFMSNVADSIYTGDETNHFDPTKLQRLQSGIWKEGLQFYEIDFNNDGIPEYFSKIREYDESLQFKAYRFAHKETDVIPYDFRKEGNYLSQPWFKKLDDKIFTFKMMDKCGYYYLNVSLVEGCNITQVQSYIIMPKMDYEISFDRKTW